jgi:hypothetical protein
MCHSVAGSANSHQQLNTGRVVRAPAGARHAQPQDPACMPGRPDLERIPARRRRVPVSLPAVTSAGFVTITKQSSARRSDEAGNCWLLTTTTRTTPYLISLSLSPRAPPDPSARRHRYDRAREVHARQPLRRDQRGMHSYVHTFDLGESYVCTPASSFVYSSCS